MILLYLILTIFQQSDTPEQKALDFFADNIYLDESIYKNSCPEDDPDCISLGTLIPDKFIGKQFLDGYTIFIKSTADEYPQNNSYPSSLELELDGQELYDRKIRIADAVNTKLNLLVNQKDSINHSSLVINNSAFKSHEKYDPTIDKWVYLEVSKALFTGQEYYVELDLYTNYYGPFDFNDSFGYRFIFNSDLELVDWLTVY